MQRIRWIAVLTAALMLPGIAMAASSSARSAAEKQCRTERQTMTPSVFKSAWGTNKNKSNAFGKCVSHRTAQNSSDESSAQSSAQKQCRSQQSNDPKGFASQWGSKHNAFGKCVSTTARAMADKDESTQVSDEDNAARQCRSEQSQDAAAFKAKYGTNGDRSNAFGKCVSQKARAQEAQQGIS